MSGKRPIKAFYVSKKKQNSDISRISTSTPIPSSNHSIPGSASLKFADLAHTSRTSSDVSSGQRTFLSSTSGPESTFASSRSRQHSSLIHKDVEENIENKANFKRRCLLIVAGVIVAVCLISLIAVLAVLIKNQSKGNVKHILT